MPTREKITKPWNNFHGITSMEYGWIFHVMRIGKYYCKNMKYRIDIYIYMCTIFFVIERTTDLIYLKFVAIDFSPKITSPSTGENSGDSA